MGTKKGRRGRGGQSDHGEVKNGGQSDLEGKKKEGGPSPDKKKNGGGVGINPNPSVNKKSDYGAYGGAAVRTYFKVFAAFKCSNNTCNKTWSSAHAWEREDDDNGIDCEVCQRPAELVNAVDEMLKLDTYICLCENIWQSIHVETEEKKKVLVPPQKCDICGVMVSPDGPPQERFGRHYWLRCLNDKCPEKGTVEWEDFSLKPQKTQRCTKCYQRGDIVKVSKLRQLPRWVWMKRRMERLAKRGDGDENDMEERPSNHVTEFCEMCQDIIRQGKGRNCRQWRLIKTKMVSNEDGGEQEEIVDMKNFSDNPFHYNTKPKEAEAEVQVIGNMLKAMMV